MEDQKLGTVVLAHGAWLDASAWREVLIPLGHEGFQVRAAQLPFKSFEGDVAALELLLDQVAAPVLLVGHSYAGAVVAAAGSHPKVRALGFVAAFAPEADEVFSSLLHMHPPATNAALGPDASGYLWIDADYAADALAQDLHRGYLNLAAATQKPVSYRVFEARLQNPAWRSKPSHYLVATEDRILHPETQRSLAARIHARTEEAAGSHWLLLSQPAAVAQFLRNSAESLVG